MQVAVRSRFTNIHGGYEEKAKFSGRPALRKTTGETWLFSAEGSWHFGPSLPSASARGASVYFSSESDSATPELATWDIARVERIWVPSPDAGQATGSTLFVDKGFPPTRKSLGEIPALANKTEPQWYPARELRAGRWELFGGSVSPNDLLQGSIGNCWLVAAMASLAEYPHMVEDLFLDKDITPSGKYHIKLFDAKQGREVTVTIDELIPCLPREWWEEEGTPLFARPNGNEAWVLLLEKAFAKMLGSYRALSGGNSCTAFRALTGEKNVHVWARSEGELARVEGAWKKLQLADKEDYFEFKPSEAERKDGDELWREVSGDLRRSYLVACSTRERHGKEHIREDGLVEAHAYSLLHVAALEGHRLVYLRNPWGNDKKWNGAWSDRDDAWAKNPKVRRRLQPSFENDGTFWMSWTDFESIFDFVFVCPKVMRSQEEVRDQERRIDESDAPLYSSSRLAQRQKLQPSGPSPVQEKEGVEKTAPSRTRRRIREVAPEQLPRLPLGAVVELWTSRPGLDGRPVVVRRFDEATGRYLVGASPPRYWECADCGETNKWIRKACNVCSKSRPPDTELLETLDGRALEVWVSPDEVVLPVGSIVEVRGLDHFSELNGQKGRIVAFDRASGRYHVELPDGRPRAIRPPHVHLLPTKVAGSTEAPQGEGSPESRPPPLPKWSKPRSDVAYVDEPEAPQDVNCDENDWERLAQSLTEEDSTLHRDVDLTDGTRLRRGQQLLREGPARGLSLADLFKQRPMKLRFSAPSAVFWRLGGRWRQVLLDWDVALTALIVEDIKRKQHQSAAGHFSFYELSQPTWVPVHIPAAPTAPPSSGPKDKTQVPGSSSKGPKVPTTTSQKSKPRAWAGWMCPDCGAPLFVWFRFS